MTNNKSQQYCEQKLVDIMFEIAFLSAEHFNGKSREDIATWVAGQLADMGFETTPCGASWGILTKYLEP